MAEILLIFAGVISRFLFILWFFIGDYLIYEGDIIWLWTFGILNDILLKWTGIEGWKFRFTKLLFLLFCVTGILFANTGYSE